MTTDEAGSPHAIHALVLVRLPGPDPAPFRRFLAAEPEIDAAWHVVGDIDLVVKVACPSLPELDRLITAMRTRGGAAATVTHLVVGVVALSPVASATTGPTTTDPGTTDPEASDPGRATDPGTTDPDASSPGTATDLGRTDPGTPAVGDDRPRQALPPTEHGWQPSPSRTRQAGRRTVGAGAAR